MTVELVHETWPGRIGTATIGATAAEGGTRSRTITVGGHGALPFQPGDAPSLHRPVVAIEVFDAVPPDWPEHLRESLGDVLDSPADWARKGVEEFGADLICLRLFGPHPDVNDASPDAAAATVRAVLEAVDVPLIVLDADGATAEIGTAILLLLYLLESTGRDLEGEWVSFEQLPGGAGYMGSFRGRVMGPVLRTFGSNPDALLAAGAALGGERLALGDAAVRLPALPRVPIAYILWAGDADFAPSASVVFDASVEGYLDAEAVTVLAELATRRLIDPTVPDPYKE